LSGLTQANSYSLRVRARCGGAFGTTTDWSASLDFSTLCDDVTSFSEDFDSSSTLPNCYDTVASGTNAFADVLTTGGASGTNFVRLRKYLDTEISTLILPNVSNLGGDYRLTFNVNNFTGADSSVFNVGTVDDSGVFTSFQEITITTNASWEPMIVDFSTYTGTDNKIAITAGYNATSNTNGQYSDTLVDDVVWEENPSCLAVSGITHTSEGTDGTSLLFLGQKMEQQHSTMLRFMNLEQILLLHHLYLHQVFLGQQLRLLQV
jgi:hypothetical protein